MRRVEEANDIALPADRVEQELGHQLTHGEIIRRDVERDGRVLGTVDREHRDAGGLGSVNLGLDLLGVDRYQHDRVGLLGRRVLDPAGERAHIAGSIHDVDGPAVLVGVLLEGVDHLASCDGGKVRREDRNLLTGSVACAGRGGSHQTGECDRGQKLVHFKKSP